jgi:hypothetical protein
MLNTTNIFSLLSSNKHALREEEAMRQQLCMQIASKLKVTFSFFFFPTAPLGVPVFVVS